MKKIRKSTIKLLFVSALSLTLLFIPSMSKPSVNISAENEVNNENQEQNNKTDSSDDLNKLNDLSSEKNEGTNNSSEGTTSKESGTNQKQPNEINDSQGQNDDSKPEIKKVDKSSESTGTLDDHKGKNEHENKPELANIANVKVKYLNKDLSVYQEYDMHFTNNTIVDASDLPMLPDNLKFDDDFMFYKVETGKENIITRIITNNVIEETKHSDSSTQTNKIETKNDGTQTDLNSADISRLENDNSNYKDLTNKLLKDKNADTKTIEDLKAEIRKIQAELEDEKEEHEQEHLNNYVEKLQNKVKTLENKNYTGNGYKSSVNSNSNGHNYQNNRSNNQSSQNNYKAEIAELKQEIAKLKAKNQRNLSDKYSADARQFVTFKTKSGKTFHLIIDHDAKEENVQLLTEVSEDDLLNVTAPESTELKPTEAPKPEQTEPVKEEPKKEEGTSLGTYLLLGLIMVGAVVGGMYYKKYKAQEKADLQSLEDDESDDEITFNESDDYFDEDDSEQNESPSENNSSDKNKAENASD